MYLEYFSLFAHRNYCDENFRGQSFFLGGGGGGVKLWNIDMMKYRCLTGRVMKK